ncbi:mitotic checkpoint regulator, MAD2B-interacting-domain-containing protein [Diaporthe sp. PMI_573]|nr:mitotic checkpoint regulator, MAD2B-interacting-domain-containing protein [Diaporthaceae sp. PMI_573]
MGLVEYSDSDSDGESRPTSPPPTAAVASQHAKKQSFQKLVDKSNPGRILVSLPSVSAESQGATANEGPAAKRLKTSGSRFSGFTSFLPPPKATTSNFRGGSSGKATPRVGVNLKTSGEAAFSRDASVDGGDGVSGTDGSGSFLNSPTATATTPPQPSIPPGQKSEDEVKLIGKPLMFKPLSVARKPSKKVGGLKATAAAPVTATHRGALERPSDVGTSGPPAKEEPPAAPHVKKKKISLFSVVDDAHGVGPAPEDSTSYEAELCGHDQSTVPEGNGPDNHAGQQQYAGYSQPPVQQTGYPDPNSLDSIADDLDLDPAARRELFGRGGAPSKATAKSVINFNLDQEYRHNEELRQSGALDQQQHNPLRAIKPGKHSLQQLVNQVQSQRDALEENFAKNRATQKQSGAKYGF